MSSVSLKNIEKTFGEFLAIDDVSLEIPEGKLTCFLGPSGCGKTTLLRVIAGLERQTAGSVWIGGQDVSHLPASQRNFGIVFQNYALFPNLRVRDNIAYGMANRGYSRSTQRQRVNELLQKVGLPDIGDKFPHALSGGQQQRVALARALAIEPKMLLLDEPLSALDAKVRAHLRTEIKALQRDLGVTTIMVTHDQEEALAMADHIIIFKDGRVEQVGEPQDIYCNPSNTFVAGFIGQMNFLKAERIEDNVAKIGKQQVRFNGARFPSQSRDVKIAIRPEDIGIQSQEAEENTLLAQLTEREYLGAVFRATFRSGDLYDESKIIADIQTQNSRQYSLSLGDNSLLTLPAEQILVFD